MPRTPLIMLIFHLPSGENRKLPVTQWRTVIGRSSKSDLKIVAKQVSKIHAAIEIDDDGVPTIRDLGSRNGVQVNGHRIRQPRELQPSDEIVLGEARMTVDPQSAVFSNSRAHAALQELLRAESSFDAPTEDNQTTQEKLRTRTHEDFAPTRQAPMLIGRPMNNGPEPLVLRMLRLAGNAREPYDVARINPFIMELRDGSFVWIKPYGHVEVSEIQAFPPAQEVWIDEPEDFGGDVMILARSTHELPECIKVVGLSETGRTPAGQRIFSEAESGGRIIIAPAD